MSFPRYESYKDSGTEWLGDVPEHWTAVPIKHLGRLKGGAGFPHIEQGLEGEELSFHKVNALAQADSYGFLQPSDNTITRDKAAQLGAFIFPPKSIVFAKVGAALLLARIRLLSEDACIDNNMMGLVVYKHEHDVGFVKYAMNLVRFDLIANPGAVPSLNESQIGNFILAAPTRDEQQTIAVFLDRETAKIDALIGEQQRLIELLKEKRQAVISHAVTKGLNPNTQMKDSGIEWLGKVPEHWEVKRLKYVAELIDGDRSSTYPSEQDIVDTGIPFLSSKNIVGYKFYNENLRFISKEKFDALSRGKIKDKDLVITVRGTIGHVAIYEATEIGYDTAFINAQMMIIRPTAISSHLLHAISESDFWKKQLDIASYGTAQQQLSNEVLQNIRLVIPPKEEQNKIIYFLERETAKLDTLTAEAGRAITLLQERRTALISAAVTGKIDVRGLVSDKHAEEQAA
jgi:type I restriction enzyme, S subunit